MATKQRDAPYCTVYEAAPEIKELGITLLPHATRELTAVGLQDVLRKADMILEYPMVDKDPVSRWTFGRVTLADDAAHPMYLRGSNGGAQALIDARTSADLLAWNEPDAALKAYEAARLEATARVVRTNHENPPDFINIRVEELTGDRPFDNLDDFISQDELRALSENYKRIAGFTIDAVAR